MSDESPSQGESSAELSQSEIDALLGGGGPPAARSEQSSGDQLTDGQSSGDQASPAADPARIGATGVPDSPRSSPSVEMIAVPAPTPAIVAESLRNSPVSKRVHLAGRVIRVRRRASIGHIEHLVAHGGSMGTLPGPTEELVLEVGSRPIAVGQLVKHDDRVVFQVLEMVGTPWPNEEDDDGYNGE